MLGPSGAASGRRRVCYNEGCGGDWILTPEHVSGSDPGPGEAGILSRDPSHLAGRDPASRTSLTGNMQERAC